MRILNLFTKHPRSVNETYLQHMTFAARNGVYLILGGLAAIVHSIFPFVFTTKASSIALKFLSNITDRMPVVNEEFEEFAHKIIKKSKKQ